MSDPKHPIWELARTALRVIVVGACLALFYNSVDMRDLLTIITVALSDPAIRMLKPPSKEE